MKHRTNKQKFADLADVYKCVKEGTKVKRQGTKDGSIATHPVVDIVFPKSEKIILSMCLEWLKHHHIFCKRSNVGAGEFGSSGYRVYGIVGSADITGLLPNGIRLEIECKAGKGGRLSKVQQKWMQNIRDNNGLYFVCHGVEELEYYMKGLV